MTSALRGAGITLMRMDDIKTCGLIEDDDEDIIDIDPVGIEVMD